MVKYEHFKVTPEGVIIPYNVFSEKDFAEQLDAIRSYNHSIVDVVCDGRCVRHSTDNKECTDCHIRIFEACISNKNVHGLYIENSEFTIGNYEHILGALKHNRSIKKLCLFSDWLAIDHTPDPKRVLDLILSMFEHNTSLKEFEIYYLPQSVHEETILRISNLLKLNRKATLFHILSHLPSIL